MRFQASMLLLALLGCQGERTNSALKVTNGIKSKPNRFTAVISQDGCTGTFVSPRTIITAAHCADHGFTYNGVKTQSYSSMPDITGKPWDYSIDVRLLVFDRDVAPAWIPISNDAVKKDDPIIYAGYGTYDVAEGKNDGQFRYGTNVVSGFQSNDQLIETIGSKQERVNGSEGEGSSVGPGDSGGPMLREGQVIGVTSAIGGIDNNTQFAVHVNLTNPTIRAFLDEMVKRGVDIRFGGKGTIDWEECFDVDSQVELNAVKFEVPHSKLSSVSGNWSTCSCAECPEADAKGYVSGDLADYRPKYKNVPAGALLAWSRFKSSSSSTEFEKSGYWKGEALGFKKMSFGAQLGIHGAGDFKAHKGKIKACFN